jgi:hypothetical protein
MRKDAFLPTDLDADQFSRLILVKPARISCGFQGAG